MLRAATLAVLLCLAAAAPAAAAVPRDWLGDWRDVASNMDKLIASLRASVR